MSTFDEQTDFSFLSLGVSEPDTAKKGKVISVQNTNITVSRIHGEETLAKMSEARIGKPGYWLGKKRPGMTRPHDRKPPIRKPYPVMTPQGVFDSAQAYYTFMNKTRGWLTALKTNHPDHYYCIKNYDPSVKYEVPAEPPERKKRVVSDETRAKLAAARTGTTKSAETKAKMAATKLGKKHSAETRVKMKNGQNTEAALNKRRKLVMTPAGVFKGRKAAAEGNGITRALLDHRLYQPQYADYYVIKETT